jgi:hypothetical protein
MFCILLWTILARLLCCILLGQDELKSSKANKFCFKFEMGSINISCFFLTIRFLIFQGNYVQRLNSTGARLQILSSYNKRQCYKIYSYLYKRKAITSYVNKQKYQHTHPIYYRRFLHVPLVWDSNYWTSHSFYYNRKVSRGRFQVKAEMEISSAVNVINDLGFDTLTFLAVTVLVVPAFRVIKASPVSSFLINSFK